MPVTYWMSPTEQGSIPCPHYSIEEIGSLPKIWKSLPYESPLYFKDKTLKEMLIMNKQCEQCNDPTKYIVGCWDGYDPKTQRSTHGYAYSCHSTDCKIKLDADKKAAETEEEIQRIRELHVERGVDMAALESMRKGNQLNMREISDYAGISAAEYCHYRAERKEIPQDIYDKLVEYVCKAKMPNDFMIFAHDKKGKPKQINDLDRKRIFDIFDSTIDSVIEQL